MDAFENIVAMLLSREGYWVKTSYKVNLTKEEKAKTGRPSLPRPEIDVIAYKPGENLLLAVECKSYLNSRGVTLAGLSGKDPRTRKRYKYFNEPVLRKVVFKRLARQLKEEGACEEPPRIQLCLAAGHIPQCDQQAVKEYCHRNDWILYGPEWFSSKLRDLSTSDYENEPAIVAAKLALSNVGSRDTEEDAPEG